MLTMFAQSSANLDPLAEHELFKRITLNRGSQTILYITHRYSTVRHGERMRHLHAVEIRPDTNTNASANRILMLEKGKVIESGTHEELLAIPDGKYAEMSRLALGEGETDKLPNDNNEDGRRVTLTAAEGLPLPPSPPESPSLCAGGLDNA